MHFIWLMARRDATAEVSFAFIFALIRLGIVIAAIIQMIAITIIISIQGKTGLTFHLPSPVCAGRGRHRTQNGHQEGTAEKNFWDRTRYHKRDAQP